MGEPDADSSTGLFRTDAIKTADDRVGGIILGTPPGSRIYLSLLAVLLVGATVAALTITIRRSSDVPGWLAPTGETRVIVAAEGTIIELPVVEGQPVRKGQTLAVIGTGSHLRSGRLAGEAVLESFGRQEAVLGNREASARSALALASADVQARTLTLRREIATARRQRELLASREGLAELQVRQITTLVDSGYGSQIELTRRRDALLQVRQELAGIDGQIAEIEGQQAAEIAKIAVADLALRTQLAEISELREELVQGSTRAQMEGEASITAPVGGTLATLTMSLGQSVRSGDGLAMIAPGGGSFEVRLLVTPEEVGRIETGDRIDLRIKAFPYRRYGLFPAVITRISAAPAAPADLRAPFDVPTPRYMVYARPAEAGRWRTVELRPGMAVEGRVIHEQAPLWRIILGLDRS